MKPNLFHTQFFRLFFLILLAGISIQTYAAKDSQAAPKTRTITGTVISEGDNMPIIGANVWLKNSSTGAITDLDGKYSITIDNSVVGGVLVFSYIGMSTQEVAIGNQNVINVTLKFDTEKIDEVVVVGYGHQKKASVIGSISTIDMAGVKVPGSSISSVLAGQLAGVVAMNRTGEPGKASAADFYIRGVSSFTGGNTPLVLVDGIERDLDLVDVEDIASFSILKDASASAVYGVRGANGVILITTKKGAEGKPVINARVEAGFTQPTKMPEFVNSAQWADTSVAIGWYPLRNTMAATDECEYEYDALMGILKGESSADDYQQGGSKFNGLYKNLANDAATLSEVISSDYDGSRDLAVTDMDVNTNNGQFNRFYALLIGDRPYATLEPDHKIYSELYYTIDGMDTYWTQISDLEDKSVLQFITGAKSLDEWDQFCTDWHVQGGDQILELVKDYLAE